MEIALLIAEPDVSFSALHQEYFILGQVHVLPYGRSRCKLFRTCHEMLRAVVFRADLQHELGGSDGTVVRVNAASSQLTFIPFQEKGFCIGVRTWSRAGWIGLRKRTAEPNHHYRHCCNRTPDYF